MKKHIRLSIALRLVEHPGQSVLRMVFTREALCDWCVGLSLLKERLIEVLIVGEDRGKNRAELRVSWTAGPTVRVQADFGPECTQLTLTKNDLDRLLHFFLKYYRDGAAQVDHLDLEAIATGTKSKDAYITLEVPDSVPPMTPEELARRLTD